MTRWKDTLPDRSDDIFSHKKGLDGPYALSLLATALIYERSNQDFLPTVAKAATTIRAWRKRLDVDYGRADDVDERSSDRELLQNAINDVISADMCGDPEGQAMHLRWAEAALRTLWRRDQETKAAALHREGSLRALLRDEAEGLI